MGVEPMDMESYLYIISSPHPSPTKREYYHPHFADDKAEVQRG